MDKINENLTADDLKKMAKESVKATREWLKDKDNPKAVEISEKIEQFRRKYGRKDNTNN